MSEYIFVYVKKESSDTLIPILDINHNCPLYDYLYPALLYNKIINVPLNVYSEWINSIATELKHLKIKLKDYKATKKYMIKAGEIKAIEQYSEYINEIKLEIEDYQFYKHQLEFIKNMNDSFTGVTVYMGIECDDATVEDIITKESV